MAVKKNSRVKVVVSRIFEADDDGTNRSFIFSAAVVDGKVARFNIVPDAEVELPVEIIAQLKGRGVPKEVGGKLKIKPEFTITEV